MRRPLRPVGALCRVHALSPPRYHPFLETPGPISAHSPLSPSLWKPGAKPCFVLLSGQGRNEPSSSVCSPSRLLYLSSLPLCRTFLCPSLSNLTPPSLLPGNGRKFAVVRFGRLRQCVDVAGTLLRAPQTPAPLLSSLALCLLISALFPQN
jgi:hypothetical protein